MWSGNGGFRFHVLEGGPVSASFEVYRTQSKIRSAVSCSIITSTSLIRGLLRIYPRATVRQGAQLVITFVFRCAKNAKDGTRHRSKAREFRGAPIGLLHRGAQVVCSTQRATRKPEWSRAIPPDARPHRGISNSKLPKVSSIIPGGPPLSRSSGRLDAFPVLLDSLIGFGQGASRPGSDAGEALGRGRRLLLNDLAQVQTQSAPEQFPPVQGGSPDAFGKQCMQFLIQAD